MNTTKESKKLERKVHFIRVSADTYQLVSELARKEDRSATWMANHLLKKSLQAKQARK